MNVFGGETIYGGPLDKIKRELKEKNSKIAKQAGLGVRLELLNEKLCFFHLEEIKFMDFYFTRGWRVCFYEEEEVKRIEDEIERAKNVYEILKEKENRKNYFQPLYEELIERADSIGIKMTIKEDYVCLQIGKFYTGTRFFYKDYKNFIEKIEFLEDEFDNSYNNVEIKKIVNFWAVA